PGRGCVPVAGLSIFDPIYLGIDENGRPVYLNLVGRNLLVGGEPGSGKSVLVQNVLGHAALSGDVRLVLLDGKEVELGMWEQVADVFVGPSGTTQSRCTRRDHPWSMATELILIMGRSGRRMVE